MKINTAYLSYFSIILFLIYFSSQPANAQQSESSVECNEASEPVLINYGEHTVNCAVDSVTDLDAFSFVGSAGDNLRIIVRQTSGSFRLDPRLEIWDPQGEEIFNQACGDACTVRADLSLTKSGTYRVAVSDEVSNDTGNYTLQLEKIPPLSEPPSISYNASINDGINPITDIDFFAFQGTRGTDVRIIVRQTSGSFRLDPRLEIWDPQGEEIFNQACGDACTVRADLSLTKSGIYRIAVSDEVSNDTGSYQISIQCIFGECPDFLAPHTVCDVQLNQSSYTIGEVVTAQVARLANPGPDPVAVEIKTWFEGFGASPTPHLNIGSDGTFIMAPGFDRDYGPMPLFTVTEDTQSGSYEFNCRLLDPATGRPLTLDRNSFDVQ